MQHALGLAAVAAALGMAHCENPAVPTPLGNQLEDTGATTTTPSDGSQNPLPDPECPLCDPKAVSHAAGASCVATPCTVVTQPNGDLEIVFDFMTYDKCPPPASDYNACRYSPVCGFAGPGEVQIPFAVMDSPIEGHIRDVYDYLPFCTSEAVDGTLLTKAKALECPTADVSLIEGIDWERYVLLYKEYQGGACRTKRWPLVNRVVRNPQQRVTKVFLYFWQDGICEIFPERFGHWILLPREVETDRFEYLIEHEYCPDRPYN